MRQLSILTEQEVNNNRNKYTNMVGKDVTLMAIGQSVKGNVKRIYEDEHCFHLEIEHEGVNYGDEIFKSSELFARKIDNWGSLNHVKVI